MFLHQGWVIIVQIAQQTCHLANEHPHTPTPRWWPSVSGFVRTWSPCKGYRPLEMGGSVKGTLSYDTPVGNTATTKQPTKLTLLKSVCFHLYLVRYTPDGGQERCIQGCSWGTWGKQALGRQRRRWEDNIKINLHEVVIGHGLMCLTKGIGGGFC